MFTYMKKLSILCSVLLILSAPLFGTTNMPEQKSNGEGAKGHAFIHGGGGISNAQRLRFVELAGGAGVANILVVPFASDTPEETGASAVLSWRSRGATADYVAFKEGEADLPENLAKLDGVTGIWVPGGSQTLVMDMLHGTEFLERIREIHRNGGVVGGSSAGAAIASEIMITGRAANGTTSISNHSTIREGAVHFVEGFGIIDFAIIDQHFAQRQRHNRLINLVIEHNLPGIGIDEDTAIIFENGSRTFEVMGTRSVLVFEPRFTTPPQTDDRKNLSADNIEVRIFLSGDRHTLE